MDMNANLARQQELLGEGYPDNSYARYEMYDLRVALREWLARGGAEPDWSAYPLAAEAYKKWSSSRK